MKPFEIFQRRGYFRILFAATRHIYAGDELTIDYSAQPTPALTPYADHPVGTSVQRGAVRSGTAGLVTIIVLSTRRTFHAVPYYDDEPDKERFGGLKRCLCGAARCRRVTC